MHYQPKTLHILQSKKIKIIANYKETILLKSERAISYEITNMRALFTDLVTFVPLFQMKLLYRYKKELSLLIFRRPNCSY